MANANIQQVRYDIPQNNPGFAENFINILASGAGGYFDRQAKVKEDELSLAKSVLPALASSGQLGMSPGMQGIAGKYGYSYMPPTASVYEQAKTQKEIAETNKLKEETDKMKFDRSQKGFIAAIFKDPDNSPLAVADPKKADAYLKRTLDAAMLIYGPDEAQKESAEIQRFAQTAKYGDVPVIDKEGNKGLITYDEWESNKDKFVSAFDILEGEGTTDKIVFERKKIKEKEIKKADSKSEAPSVKGAQFGRKVKQMFGPKEIRPSKGIQDMMKTTRQFWGDFYKGAAPELGLPTANQIGESMNQMKTGYQNLGVPSISQDQMREKYTELLKRLGMQQQSLPFGR